jgi:hypothetical protein
MIRPFTCLCLLAAFGSGMYLYTEKHRAELLDRQIGRVIHETEAARQRTGLLRADWALLNDPTRLQDMSDKYLALKPLAPGQFVQLAELSNRLPAPVVTPPGGGTDEDAPVADAGAAVPAAVDAATPGAAPPADIAAAAVPALPAKQVAKAAPAHGTAKLVAHAAARKPQHPVAVAEREPPLHDGPLAPSAPLPLASPQPLGARVMSAMARPSRMVARPAVVAATPSALSSGFVGSALGSHGYVPPPVPLGAQ